MESALVTAELQAAPCMPSLLTLFGLFAVSSMLVCYAFEKQSAWFILGFSTACALGSAYGFLQGAWPFGIVEGIWSMVALQRWWRAAHRRGDGAE
jgi:hypothetical protein